MEGLRGQAVIVDAIFFLMICGMAAAGILWAGSVYGQKSFAAYSYMYLNDYETSALAVLSATEYKDGAGVSRAWLKELGDFMLDKYNETDPPGRYDNPGGGMDSLLEGWESVCYAAPAPMLLTVWSTEPAVVRGTRSEPLYLACGGLVYADDDPGKERGLLWERDPRLGDWVNPYKYPYYSSPTLSKACGAVPCTMEVKIYY
ncbi:MAG: hypothetical protein JW834_04150 [Candidatus Diapherotrites archaeon]|nr:hypothetical protein [Candidatus Diapherotrites archaeon]